MANELLPPLPQGTISFPPNFNMFVKGPVIKKPSTSGSVKEEDPTDNVPEVSAREKLLKDQPELLHQFGMDLLPILIQVCTEYYTCFRALDVLCGSVNTEIMLFDQVDLWFQCEWSSAS